MNQLTSTHPGFGLRTVATATSVPRVSAQEALQARFALRVTAALSQHNRQLESDITERLRFARENALAKVRRDSSRSGVTAPPTATGWQASRHWLRFASVLPAIALVTGLMLIQRWQDSAQISTAAEVDAALLSDDLPPTAYGDAGFVEFLKSGE